jgi:hypothetical protein
LRLRTHPAIFILFGLLGGREEMPLSDVTREAVLAAIAEFDDTGRAAFLKKYGFGPARSYFLFHTNGRRA